MKTAATSAALLMAASSLFGQGVVKKDLLEMMGRVPPPPVSVKEAFGKVAIAQGGAGRWSAEKVYGAIEKEVKDVEAAIGERMKPVGEVAPGVSADMAKTMQDPEMRKKMKKMSREEKMNMAMEMMKSAGKPAVESDPPAVRSVLEEWRKVQSHTVEEFQRGVEAQRREIGVREEGQKAHAEIDRLAQAEINKLPQISSGEMSAPDPAKVKAVKLRANEKHIALSEKQLREAGERWRASFAQTKGKFSEFYAKLMAADYASGTSAYPTIKVLSDAQLMFLKEIDALIALSRQATEESARWLAQRGEIEKE
jgi:hypothetical protein